MGKAGITSAYAVVSDWMEAIRVVPIREGCHPLYRSLLAVGLLVAHIMGLRAVAPPTEQYYVLSFADNGISWLHGLFCDVA